MRRRLAVGRDEQEGGPGHDAPQPQSLAWLGVVAAVLMVLGAPVLIAAIRGAEPISLVILLTVLALGTGPVTWLPALIAAFALPRSRPLRPEPPRGTPARLLAGQRAMTVTGCGPEGRAGLVPEQAPQAQGHLRTGRGGP